MKKIKFKAKTSEIGKIVAPPVPASTLLPKEYKTLPLKIHKDMPHLLPNQKNTNFTMKACIPVFDAMTSGYMLTLPNDIVATKDPRYPHRLFWEVGWTAISVHEASQYGQMKIPDGYEKDPFKFEGVWSIETPPGYSLLMTHPFNRFDLPFITLTGIVDSDSYYNLPINLPFLLKEDFEGILKKGTPIAQIIPIKRESWKSELVESTNDHSLWINDLKSVAERSYKNRFWFKKKYE